MAYLFVMMILQVLFYVDSSKPPFSQSILIRGGSSFNGINFESLCMKTVESIFNDAEFSINKYYEQIESNRVVEDLGSKCDFIVQNATTQFRKQIPSPTDDLEKQHYETNMKYLEERIEAPIHFVQLKQLTLVRDKTLNRFRASLKRSELGEFEALMRVNDYFRTESDKVERKQPINSVNPSKSALTKSLSTSKQRLSIPHSSLVKMCRVKKHMTDVKLHHAKSQEELIHVLQDQQNKIKQLEEIIQGSTSPINTAFSVKIPNTQIGITGMYHNAKGSIQVTCVPDDSSHLMTGSGFSSVKSGDVGIVIGGTI